LAGVGGIVLVRAARPSDLTAIRDVHLDAFGDEGLVVADLALALIADESAKPLLALVAERNGVVVGSVIFSAVHIDGNASHPSRILAPLAVATPMQRTGAGRRLVEQGLAMLREECVDLVFVLGNPGYYARYGFRANHRVRAPYDLRYPQAWMALSLQGTDVSAMEGQLVCPQSLHRAELW
jgi:putative acetyltransferase